MDKQPSWEVSWYSKEDKPAILTANQEEYGDSDLAHTSYFDWVVQKNPNGPPIFPVAHETDTGRVIGWVLYIPFQILWKGVVNKVLVGFNLMVRKEYRHQGICTEIIRSGMADAKRKGHQFMAALANSRSTSVHRKMGDLIAFTIPMVVRPMDIVSLTKSFIKKPLLQWVVRNTWRIAGSTIFRENHPHNGKITVEIKEECEIGVEFDSFWEKVKGKYNLILARDRTFLQWRFCEMPLRSYRILTVRQKNEILGYIVFRITDIRRIRCGMVSDFMVMPGRDGDTVGLLLMNAATQFFREAQVQLGGGLMMPHTQEYRIMRKAGYVRCPDNFSPQSITLIIHHLLGEIPTKVIQRPGSWFITNADHDAV